MAAVSEMFKKVSLSTVGDREAPNVLQADIPTSVQLVFLAQVPYRSHVLLPKQQLLKSVKILD